MRRVLIIGKKSFLGSNLKKRLSKYFKIDNYSYENVIFKNNDFFIKYSHIINTTIHQNYIKKKYNNRYDLDRNFINKFDKFNFFYIFLNTRKIYKIDENINERSIKLPLDNYSKNKLITEKFLKKTLNKKLISLRISNVLGKRIYNNLRNHHKLFLDRFYKLRKNKKLLIKNDYKDFISIIQFCTIIKEIIQYKIAGVYNVSLGKKIYVSQLLSWLDNSFFKKAKFVSSKSDSFTLSNKKLLKKIKFKIKKRDLEIFCKKLI